MAYDQTFRRARKNHIKHVEVESVHAPPPSQTWRTRSHRLTSLLGSDPVDRVIGLTHASYLTAKSDGGRGLQGLALGIDVSDLDLDRGVVLGGDESVCTSRRCRAGQDGSVFFERGTRRGRESMTHWWPNTFGGRKGQRVLPAMIEMRHVSNVVASQIARGSGIRRWAKGNGCSS